jgi:hypothetical protein
MAPIFSAVGQTRPRTDQSGDFYLRAPRLFYLQAGPPTIKKSLQSDHLFHVLAPVFIKFSTWGPVKPFMF